MALRIIYLWFTYFVCLLDISWEQKTFHWIVIQQQAFWIEQTKFSSIFTIFFKYRSEGYFLLDSIFGYNFLRSRTVEEWLLKEFKSCLGVSNVLSISNYVNTADTESNTKYSESFVYNNATFLFNCFEQNLWNRVMLIYIALCEDLKPISKRVMRIRDVRGIPVL